MPQDPYAEFGGQTIEATAANDPYAEFGGQTITQPGESAFVTNRPQLPTPSEVIAPLAQGMQPDTTSAFTGNRFTITPQAGESFSDTMNRAAQAGKTVTPQEISSQGMKGLKESSAVLAAATAIGATLPAMAAGMGELAAPTTQTVTKGAGYLAQQVEQEGPSLLRQGAGAVAKFAAKHKLTTGGVGLLVLNKLGIGLGQILEELIPGSTEYLGSILGRKH